MFDQSYYKFHRIADEVMFSDPDRMLSAARTIIERADENIIDLMVNFGIRANPLNNTAGLPTCALEKLNGAPAPFMGELAKFIDLSDIEDDVKDRNLRTLAGFVNDRFTAISIVAQAKKIKGDKTSYVPERHKDVLDRREKSIGQLGQNGIHGKKAFASFMAAGCFYQDAYIQTQQNDDAKLIPQRLTKIGITPL